MLYSYDICIPPSTPESSALWTDCDVSPGTLTRLIVIFPPGAARLAHVRIFLWSHQLYPSNLDSSLSGDSEVVDVPENLDLNDRPYRLRIQAWNDDDSFQHTVCVRFSILRITSTAGIPRWLQKLLMGV